MLYARPHLPQGAPTSPALANVTAFRLDCRLSGLARSAGAVYTRYADDLAFSGGEEFSRGVERFSAHAAAVALEEGFGVNHHKTRIMRRGARQSLAGIVVNQRINLRRADLQRPEAPTASVSVPNHKTAKDCQTFADIWKVECERVTNPILFKGHRQ